MRRFGRNDIIFLTGLAVVSVLLFVVIYVTPFWGSRQLQEAGPQVLITIDGQEWNHYPLNEERTVEITDEDGYVTNVLEIKDGYANMISADCPDKLCVLQHEICDDTMCIVCLPNRVMVEIVGGKESGIDSVAQ